jgi:hypothetical protein
MSPGLGQSLERAHRSARDQSHRLVTLEHLLLALTEDGEAALILQSANVDLARLGTDVSGYLGRLMEDMRAEPGTEPRPDAELLRVLLAAASAARQSRRKQIDGAIVLAAIVGDGKSPAAGLLKALGMTFEEAIRALQRANTKARLKPLAKAPAASPPAPAGASPAPSPASGADHAAAPADPGGGQELPITEPSTVPQSSATQSADEILAAARARIQKRSAAARTEPASARELPPSPLPYPASPAPGAAQLPAQLPGQLSAQPPGQAPVGNNPRSEPVDPAQAQSLTAAIEAAMVPSPRKVEPRLPPTVPAVAAEAPELAPPVASAPSAPSRAAWTPSLEAKPQPQGLTRLPAAARTPPFPARPLPPHEGPRRPPLPAGTASPPQPGFRPAPAPWPEAADRAQTGRPPLANGSFGELSALGQQVPERADLAPRRLPAQRAGMPGEKGLLIEAVPRRMRVGRAASAEVRIARDKIDGLLLALKNRDGQPSGDPPVARALSVRLRGTKGGFWVEPTTPETQWVDSRPLRAEDDHIAWRWTVVPRRRGRNRLTVMVTVHTAGRDGAVATTSPPDRVIDVSVRLNRLRRAARVTGWIVAGLAGAALARFGLQYWPLVSAIFKNVLG